MRLYHFVVLTRPANIITAIADILAGAAIAGIEISSIHLMQFENLLLLMLSTIGLYGSGVVLNDAFDAELDKKERPERPIPTGLVSRTEAFAFGFTLMSLGIYSAFLFSTFSGVIAVIVALMILLYDGLAKHHIVFGPLVMGLCRGGNLLLGMSIIPGSIHEFGFMALIPIIFIAAITLTSRGEVLGNNKLSLMLALSLDFVVIGFLAGLGIYNVLDLLSMVAFLTFWAFLNIRAKLAAIANTGPENVKRAVKTGVISLIPLDASYAAGFGGFLFGMVVLALLPLSLFLAKRFAVT